MDAEQIRKDLRAEPSRELRFFFATKYGQRLATLDLANVDKINITAGQLLEELSALFPDVTLKQFCEEIKADKRRQGRKQKSTNDQQKKQQGEKTQAEL